MRVVHSLKKCLRGPLFFLLKRSYLYISFGEVKNLHQGQGSTYLRCTIIFWCKIRGSRQHSLKGCTLVQWLCRTSYDANKGLVLSQFQIELEIRRNAYLRLFKCFLLKWPHITIIVCTFKRVEHYVYRKINVTFLQKSEWSCNVIFWKYRELWREA